MAGGNKKNKRGSSSSLQQHPSPTTELIERSPENDYGVLSDPDEQPSHPYTRSPTYSDYEDQHPSQLGHDAQKVDDNPVVSHSLPVIPECSHILDELSPTLHSSLQSSPQSSPKSSPKSSPQSLPLTQDQHLSIQPPISQSPTSNKSLETLKLKLTRDKNFSRKMTLHTFFSYIILAMEIQRSCSASIAHLSVKSVQDLVLYMIQNHSSSNPVRIYLLTLVDTGIVTNIIESIIDFNKDNKNSSFETLYTLEENELEMFILQSSNTTTATTATATTATINTTATAAAVNDVKVDDATEKSENLPQTPQKCGFFKRMRRCCFFSGCCG